MAKIQPIWRPFRPPTRRPKEEIGGTLPDLHLASRFSANFSHKKLFHCGKDPSPSASALFGALCSSSAVVTQLR